MHVIRPDKGRLNRSSIRKKETIRHTDPLAAEVQLKTQVCLTVEDDVWSHASNLSSDGEKTAPLFRRVRTSAEQPSQPTRGASAARKARNGDLPLGSLPRAFDQPCVNSRQGLQSIECFPEKGFNPATADSHPGAAKKQPDRLRRFSHAVPSRAMTCEWVAIR